MSFRNSILFLSMAATVVGCRSNSDVERETRNQIGAAVRSSHAVVLHRDAEQIDISGDSPHTLLLSDAIQQAIDHDPSLQAALARVRAAEADADQARLLPNPIINFDVKIPDGGGKPKIEGSLAEDLVAVLEMPRRSSAADNRLRGASADALGVALDVVAEIQEHYANIQTLSAQAAVLDDRRRLLERLAKIARAKIDAGEGAPLEATTIEAQQLSLSQEIAQRKADELDERLVLTRLIGQPTGSAAWQVSPWQMLAVPSDKERIWISTALTRRPEIAAGKWELAALGDDAALAGFATFEGAQIGAVTERDAGWLTGPSIGGPIPLFDWGQARRVKATANQMEARHKLLETERQVVEEVRRAYAGFAAAHKNVSMAQTRVIPLQERRRQQAEAAYETGETDVTTLVVAEQELQQARSDLIDLQQKMTLSLLHLERAVGGPLVASRMEIPPTTSPSTEPATTQARTTPVNPLTGLRPSKAAPESE
jgi:cobalt-zinc-cadmium efflux system outer membrane protein